MEQGRVIGAGATAKHTGGQPTGARTSGRAALLATTNVRRGMGDVQK